MAEPTCEQKQAAYSAQRLARYRELHGHFPQPTTKGRPLS